MPNADQPPTPLPTDEEVIALYAERRLAASKGSDAWFYRQYRRLSPRARMVTAHIAMYNLAWLAGSGAYDIVTRHNQVGTAPLLAGLIGTALTSLAVDKVPFRYR